MRRWFGQWRSKQSELSSAEVRRRRRDAVLIGIAAAVFGIFAVLQTRLPEFTDSASQSGNVTFFLLINVNLILLVLLIFLVTRNLVKLLFERRRGILGARLRTRLILAFASLSLVPIVVLFLVAEGFFSAGIDNWFRSQVQNALAGSLKVAHRYYQQAGNNALHFATELSDHIQTHGLLAADRVFELQRFVDAKRVELNVAAVEVVVGREPVAAAYGPERGQHMVPIAPVDLNTVLLAGQEFARTLPVKRGDVVRGGAPIRAADGTVVGAVVVDYLVPPPVSEAARRTAHSFEEYRQLKALKQPIVSGYRLTFSLITLVVLFSATWFSFYFAKGITVPIQGLGEGMREVAQGNLDYRAESGGDEEIATLVTSFNQMTAQLKTTHSALEERHHYIENILANITAGVVSIDSHGIVATVNPAAGSMLGVRPEEAHGRAWQEVFQPSHLQPLAELLTQLLERNQGRVEQQIKLDGLSPVLTAWVTATTLTDDASGSRGIMLFLEDVTFLLRVERMEAWREVARRIAHEIKNPLTPIQLSAQRLRKQYGAVLGTHERGLLDECTRTIIGQVDQLKRLVNEFSTFARLPAAEVTPQDLNDVVEEAFVLFRDGHPDIRFILATDPSVPMVEIDRDAIKRAIINLLDNAVAACRDADSGARIELATTHDPAMGVVRLEVADNGHGMTPQAKARAFEPYFSTKRDGTGLGLAIVSAIVADHQAYVRVHDNVPQGTRLVIEFPLRRAAPLREAARA